MILPSLDWLVDWLFGQLYSIDMVADRALSAAIAEGILSFRSDPPGKPMMWGNYHHVVFRNGVSFTYEISNTWDRSFLASGRFVYPDGFTYEYSHGRCRYKTTSVFNRQLIRFKETMVQQYLQEAHTTKDQSDYV